MSYVQMKVVYLVYVVYPSTVKTMFFTMFQGEAQTIKQYQGEKCKFWFSACSAFQEGL